ncbi:MAG TPA: ABC transporter ATP-binding protein, partial [Acidimicrobiales bacterium]|nr:ABC transporter ATP-binding protein [Acidimicrobiales bacterium]
ATKPSGVVVGADGRRLPLLEVVDVSAGYGPYRALFGVPLSVPTGAALAVLGANGAGKTTLARVVSGLIRPTSGRLLLEGEDVTGEPAWRLARRGVRHVPEGRSVFASLTVEENMVLELGFAVGRDGTADALARAYELFPRTADRRRQLAGTLSGGEQRMLALAPVLACSPRLLVVDELSLGLAPVLLDQVYDALRSVRETGTTMIVIEQRVHHALGLADRVVVLDKGVVSFDGPADSLDPSALGPGASTTADS